jgi:putative ATP-binding cassette transporter
MGRSLSGVSGTLRINDDNGSRFPGERMPPHPLRRFLQSASGYWTSQPAREAWIVSTSLVVVVLVSLGITYSINLWNRSFFDAIEAKNTAIATHQAILFPVLVGAYLVLCVFGMWARMTLQRTWRAWVNEHILTRWLDKSRFYKLELTGGDHKNPEHRINDDLRIATEMPVDFVTGFMTALLSAVAFMGILWMVGGSLAVQAFGLQLRIPGFLVIAAFLYALLANGLMLAIAFRFIPITQQKNQAEAEYRYALTRVRENAQSIALLGGGAAEQGRLGQSFASVVARWRDLMVQHMRTVIVSQGSAQLCGVVPILLCTPRYLDGTMTLGQVMQLASAFVIVQGALSWFMENYTRVADWTASARRVGSLLAALDDVERCEHERASIRSSVRGGPELHTKNLSVMVPDGRPLVRRASVKIQPGERVLVVGDSGSGKSSLLRAIAGCWPWVSGEIVCIQGRRMLVLPQRPYVPTGTLREAAVYPLSAAHSGDDGVANALAMAGLAHYLPQVDLAASWDAILSGGEKQRLAIARALLHRPDLLALDEATSALPVAAQAEMMALILRALPQATIISVGHRPELEAFHDRKLTIARRPDGARIVSDVALQQRAFAPKISRALLLPIRAAG